MYGEVFPGRAQAIPPGELAPVAIDGTHPNQMDMVPVLGSLVPRFGFGR
jgi:hypothetical protein